MPAQRPFKVGDVLVTKVDASTGLDNKRVPAGTTIVVTRLTKQLSEQGVFALIPSTGTAGALFWKREIAHPEDLTDG